MLAGVLLLIKTGNIQLHPCLTTLQNTTKPSPQQLWQQPGAAAAVDYTSGASNATAAAAAALAAVANGTAVDPLLLHGYPLQIADTFPQVTHCGLAGTGAPRRWMQQYAHLHAAIIHSTMQQDAESSSSSSTNSSSTNSSGSSSAGMLLPRKQQRYLVSIPHLSGTADHVIGMVTQFYLALLGQRAFTEFSPPDHPPGLAAACDFPFFNWTHPQQLPDALLAPLPKEATSRTDIDPNEAAIYPDPYDNYALHNMVNPLDSQLEVLSRANLTNFPVGSPTVQYVLSTTNRGASYALLRNPRHKEQFWREFGLRPETAFMCGFWSLCSPNAAVKSMYAERYWAPLRQPKVFKIGIQVRFGDALAFLHNEDMSAAALMAMAAPYFECAVALEQEYAQAGQQSIWFVISDSGAFRRAARQKYGDKVLTDDELQLMHVACHLNDDPSLCQQSNLESAVQHSVGEQRCCGVLQLQQTSAALALANQGLRCFVTQRWPFCS
jgi:hypothetical protein